MLYYSDSGLSFVLYHGTCTFVVSDLYSFSSTPLMLYVLGLMFTYHFSWHVYIQDFSASSVVNYAFRCTLSVFSVMYSLWMMYCFSLLLLTLDGMFTVLRLILVLCCCAHDNFYFLIFFRNTNKTPKRHHRNNKKSAKQH